MARRGSVLAVSKKSPQWLAEWPETEEAIHRFARGRLPVGVDPDDVSQQVVLKLLAAGSDAPPADRVKFWALRVARNVVADLYRGKKLQPGDLPTAPLADVEEIALARLRCEAAATAYTTLSIADRQALADPAGGSRPLSNRTKLRRSRARRVLRDKAEQTVGIAFVVRRLRWLLAPTSAAAIVVPLCVGLAPPAIDPAQGAAPRQETIVVRERPKTQQPVTASVVDQPIRSQVLPPPAAVGRTLAPEYYWRASVDLPDRGPAGYDNFDPHPEEEPPPLACARNLRVADDVCVDHPLR